MKGLRAAESVINLNTLRKIAHQQFRFSELEDFFFGKRTKIAITSLLATILAFAGLQFSGFWFLGFLIIFLVLIFLAVVRVLSEDLAGVKYITIPALPIFYLASFLLLVKFLELSVPGILAACIVLGISFYFLLLTQNIYNIASHRSIGLVRAAAVSGTLFYVISAFLAFGVIWLHNWLFWIIVPCVFGVSFVLFTLSIWAQQPKEIIDGLILSLSGVLAIVLAQIALALTFWPILPLIGALVLAICFYVILGLVQFKLQERLTKKVVYEYVTIAGVVLVLILATTRWGG